MVLQKCYRYKIAMYHKQAYVFLGVSYMGVLNYGISSVVYGPYTVPGA